MNYLFIALLFWIYPVAVSSQHFENWGDQGDRIGIYNYNTLKEAGFVDVDYFRYEYRR